MQEMQFRSQDCKDLLEKEMANMVNLLPLTENEKIAAMMKVS